VRRRKEEEWYAPTRNSTAEGRARAIAILERGLDGSLVPSEMIRSSSASSPLARKQVGRCALCAAHGLRQVEAPDGAVFYGPTEVGPFW